jgi:hypothetical protein
LFQDSRLSRLAEQGATLPAGSAYTLADLFSDVRRGVFGELGTQRPTIDAYRRNLQRAFVDQMERLISTPLAPERPSGFGPGGGGAPPRPGDARALARLELEEVQAAARTARPRAGDRTTRAHLGDLLARIDQILNPQ